MFPRRLGSFASSSSDESVLQAQIDPLFWLEGDSEDSFRGSPSGPKEDGLFIGIENHDTDRFVAQFIAQVIKISVQSPACHTRRCEQEAFFVVRRNRYNVGSIGAKVWYSRGEAHRDECEKGQELSPERLANHRSSCRF